MVFSDQSFLFLFLPVTLVIYFTLRATPFATTVILLASLVFYFWTSGFHVLLLVASLLINFLGGLWVSARSHRLALPIVITLNLALLIYFKYAFFAANNFGVSPDEPLGEWLKAIVLPIGISFFTFQGISYVVDVARGTVAPERGLINFGAYLSFFPQLIAGPIVRYRDVERDFCEPKTSMENFAAGASRFMHGLVKKIVVADTVAPIADAAFALPAENVTCIVALLGATAFAIQIYFDFSGYSDMAIGLGLMFGIRFHENFERPYASKTITEFWRRWHISLSTWFRDYLYIPLGGDRHGNATTYRNLLIAFVATGIWHGAAWTFLAWGLYQGFFIVIERCVLGSSAKNTNVAALRYVYCLPVVLIGWIIFRSDTIGEAWTFASALGAPFAKSAFAVPPSLAAALTPNATAIFAIACLIFVLPGRYGFGQWLSTAISGTRGPFLRTGYLVACMSVALVMVLSQTYSPFLYFRF